VSAATANMSIQNTRRDMLSFVVERSFGWSVSKVYNLAASFARIFEAPAKNDLSLLKFEMTMLDSFMATMEFDPLEAEVRRAESSQSSMLYRIHAAGGVDALGGNEELLAEYVEVNTNIEMVVAKVHTLYAERVTFKNIF